MIGRSWKLHRERSRWFMPNKSQTPSETRHCLKRTTIPVKTVTTAILIQEQLQTCQICSHHTARRLNTDPQEYGTMFRQLQNQSASPRSSATRLLRAKSVVLPSINPGRPSILAHSQTSVHALFRNARHHFLSTCLYEHPLCYHSATLRRHHNSTS